LTTRLRARRGGSRAVRPSGAPTPEPLKAGRNRVYWPFFFDRQLAASSLWRCSRRRPLPPFAWNLFTAPDLPWCRERSPNPSSPPFSATWLS